MTMMFSELAAGEIDRLVREHGLDRSTASPRDLYRLHAGGVTSPLRPSWAGQGTAEELEGRADAMLTHDVVDGARRELAARHPLLDVETVEAATLALSGGERDVDSLAAALVQLAYMESRDIQRIALAADVSAAERRELAKKGWALADGSYPVKDRAHLHSAAILAASGHGDVKAARALIRKRAAELGVPLHTLPGFSDEDEEDRAHHRRRRRARPGEPGSEPRYPRTDGSDTFNSPMAAGVGGPSGSGGDAAAMTATARARRTDGTWTTIALTGAQGRELGLAADSAEGDDDGPQGYYLDLAASAFGTNSAAEPPFRVHEVSRDDTEDVDHEAEVDRYLKMLGQSAFMRAKEAHPMDRRRGYSAERPYGNSETYRPPSLAERNRAERAQNSRFENPIEG